MRTNMKFAYTEKTHEGVLSPTPSAEQELRRAIMSCMLFEDQFYESGVSISDRIKALVHKLPFDVVAAIAIEARSKQNLRHAPLLLVRELLRNHSGRKVGDLIHAIIQRPDELGELLSLYWQENKDAPLTAQLKIGLARGLKKFDEYRLAKYNRDTAVKLRDVLFLSHAKPDNEAQATLFKKLAQNELVTPDTWEVALSGGADKKEVFTRLIGEGKLGALALLRNLRGMLEVDVSEDVIREGLAKMKTERVLPFRFISAAKHAPRLEDALEQAMFRSLSEIEKLPSKTALLIDHSGSMSSPVSGKSQVTRFDAACGVAMILRECSERVRFFAFSDRTVEVPPRRGFALIQAARECMGFGGTYLGQAVKSVYQAFPECERLIIITDEQSADRPPHPQGRGYIVNVASNRNGIGYGPWLTVDGWSESILDFIKANESIA